MGRREKEGGDGILGTVSGAALGWLDDAVGGAQLRSKLRSYREGAVRKYNAADDTARYVGGRVWSAWAVYWKLCCVAVVLMCLFWSMVVASVVTGAAASAGSYVFLIPEPQGASLPFSFNYNFNPPEARIPIQSYYDAHGAWGGKIPRESRIQAVAYPFHSESHYNFTVRLSIPETPHNLRHGVFTVDVGVWGVVGGAEVELSRLSRSAALQAPQSDLTRQVSELLLLPVSLAAGGSAPTQLLSLNMNSLWQPFANENISYLTVTLNPSIHVHTSQLIIEEERTGIPGMIQRHPVTFTALVFLAASAGTFLGLSFGAVALALVALVFIAKRQYDKARSPPPSPAADNNTTAEQTLKDAAAAAAAAPPRQERIAEADRTDSDCSYISTGDEEQRLVYRSPTAARQKSKAKDLRMKRRR
eukprot:TRINITY_DN2832_c3_g1_i1.p1 TRINITY_DN2832_c3_g1~~TRINITY_DN2832_c3_g1_i1.p1  ORF type:complete len:417 (+),score=128.67 TRINITY_DN2832_c3_g1_i1:40-1290(+)